MILGIWLSAACLLAICYFFNSYSLNQFVQNPILRIYHNDLLPDFASTPLSRDALLWCIPSFRVVLYQVSFGRSLIRVPGCGFPALLYNESLEILFVMGQRSNDVWWSKFFYDKFHSCGVLFQKCLKPIFFVMDVTTF